MGAQVAQISPTLFLFTYLVLASSDVATKSDESHESDEGSERCKRWKGHDSNSRVPVRCRNHRLETEGCEGSRGGHGGRSSRSVEKGWLFQDCRCAQLEAEAETRNTCAQRRHPFHERALRLQSQASIQDREGTSDEKAQRDGELIMRALCGPCLESRLEFFLVAVSGLARPR